MSNQPEDKLLKDHEYDGIQELDNPLPGWWLATFYGAIIFSVIYVGYYHVGGGPSLRDELKQDLEQVGSIKQAAKGAGGEGPSEEALLAVFNDPTQRELGHEKYMQNCASCHGQKGEGLIGPNLTDSFWIHGNGSLQAIAKVVGEGVPEKGMPPWKALLKENELYAVTAYLHTFKGTNPPNGKPPEGTEFK